VNLNVGGRLVNRGRFVMWFIIEIILALSILSTVLTGIYYLIPAFNRSTDIAKSQVKSINLKNALLNVYIAIAMLNKTAVGIVSVLQLLYLATFLIQTAVLVLAI